MMVELADLSHKVIVEAGKHPEIYKAAHGGLGPGATPERPEDLLMWSGKRDIPEIGSHPTCYMNGFGKVRVCGYFTSDGYLGVLAIPEVEPEWRITQGGEGMLANLFGIDFDPLGEKGS